MARIPSYQANVGAGFNQTRPTEDRSGQIQAQALSSFGQGVEQLGKGVSQLEAMEIEKKKIDYAITVEASRHELEFLASDLENQLVLNGPRDGSNWDKSFDEAYMKNVNKKVNAIADPELRARVDNEAMGIRNDYLARVRDFSHKAYIKNAESSLTVLKNQSVAKVAQNPASFSMESQKFAAAINELPNGIDKVGQIASANKEMASTAVNSLINNSRTSEEFSEAAEAATKYFGGVFNADEVQKFREQALAVKRAKAEDSIKLTQAQIDFNKYEMEKIQIDSERTFMDDYFAELDAGRLETPEQIEAFNQELVLRQPELGWERYNRLKSVISSRGQYLNAKESDDRRDKVNASAFERTEIQSRIGLPDTKIKDIRKEVDAKFQSGSISPDHAAALYSQINTEEKRRSQKKGPSLSQKDKINIQAIKDNFSLKDQFGNARKEEVERLRQALSLYNESRAKGTGENKSYINAMRGEGLDYTPLANADKLSLRMTKEYMALVKADDQKQLIDAMRNIKKKGLPKDQEEEATRIFKKRMNFFDYQKAREKMEKEDND